MMMSPSCNNDHFHFPTDDQALKREEVVLIALVTIAMAAAIMAALFLGYRMMKGSVSP